jgi:hypothetical protein
MLVTQQGIHRRPSSAILYFRVTIAVSCCMLKEVESRITERKAGDSESGRETLP